MCVCYDVGAKGVGEIVWVDGWVDGWVGRCEVYAAVGQVMLEENEQGEVVGGVDGGFGAGEETCVVGVRGDGADWEVDFLLACFGG